MKAEIIIVSVGSGDPELMNAKTIKTILNAERLVLRTGNHPIVQWLRCQDLSFETLDSLYDTSSDFDQLNMRAAEYLLHLNDKSPVVYAVTDAYTDSTVRTLYELSHNPGDIQTIPGSCSYASCLSYVMQWYRDSCVTVIPAADFSGSRYDPNRAFLITEIDSPLLASDIKLIFSEYLEDEQTVYFIHDGSPVRPFCLFELDRQRHFDHLTSVFVPASRYTERKKHVLSDLAELMDYLRSPDGCPWDRVQTHLTLRPYMIEEAWECVAAIDQDDPEHLSDELGDLLFQIVFHASIGKDFDEFTLNDIISGICEKMIRRHPHVFCSENQDASGRDIPDWEKLKRLESGTVTPAQSLNEIPSSLPALKYVSKILKKLRSVPSVQREPGIVISEIRSLLNSFPESRSGMNDDDLGSLLWLCAELCTGYHQDSEMLLHQTAEKMVRQLNQAEKKAIGDGKSLEDLTFEDLRVYLNYVKGEIE